MVRVKQLTVLMTLRSYHKGSRTDAWPVSDGTKHNINNGFLYKYFLEHTKVETSEYEATVPLPSVYSAVL